MSYTDTYTNTYSPTLQIVFFYTLKREGGGLVRSFVMPCCTEIKFVFLVFCLYTGRSSYRFDSLHPSLSSAILFSSPFGLPPPRLPSCVALLLPLPRLPSNFPSIAVRYKLLCLSHFFLLFFNVINNSLSTPISCSTLSFFFSSCDPCDPV